MTTWNISYAVFATTFDFYTVLVKLIYLFSFLCAVLVHLWCFLIEIVVSTKLTFQVQLLQHGSPASAIYIALLQFFCFKILHHQNSALPLGKSRLWSYQYFNCISSVWLYYSRSLYVYNMCILINMSFVYWDCFVIQVYCFAWCRENQTELHENYSNNKAIFQVLMFYYGKTKLYKKC